ncbi:hypothetical protein H6P81_020700 [Aristolochia fimbriata]|uniref:Uncharacterized protein n=1 Tax=Aristolochia fimbriata TaxID=158543 RepID=A0AAV7DV79_ARIFI|nr:hypothetical protein H6P81_020700 [Aristolochia fimbriata]
MFFDTQPPPSPSRIVYLETQISESSAKWLQAIKAGEYWEAIAHARNCLNACALVYGDYSSRLSPALYAYAVTILYKERVERRDSCNTKLLDLPSGGVAGGSSSENCKSGWPSRERYRLLNFEGIRYDEMTDTDLALSNLGSAWALITRKLQYFPKLEIVEAVADLFYERGDLNIARGYYMDALRELYALDTSGDICVLQRAKINFKACLLLVATDFGSDVLTYAEKVWSDGISYGKSSLNEAQGKVQRSLLSDLEQMEDWPEAFKRGGSYLEEILKKIINKFSELIDIHILVEMGLCIKQATFIPGEDVQVRPAPESDAFVKDDEDWMRRMRRVRKKRMVDEDDEEEEDSG